MRRNPFPRCAAFLLLTLATTISMWSLTHTNSQAAQLPVGQSVRFFGNGQGDIDRIKIPLEPHNPVDIGAGDFTIEWWMKTNRGDNAAQTQCSTNDGWIYGNILFDRDIWGAGDIGDYGIALNQGKIAMGVNRLGEGTTICGEIAVDDGAWHHIAITRVLESGMVSIYVDGRLDRSGVGPLGDISYRDGRPTGYADDPFLVIGAEKHDAGSEYPSYSGWVDEVRISTTIRYQDDFPLPSEPFLPDELTVALFHFDEGSEGPCQGDILNGSFLDGAVPGDCRYGGGPSQGPVYDLDSPFLPVQAEPFTATVTLFPSATAQEVTETSTPTLQPTLTPEPVEDQAAPEAEILFPTATSAVGTVQRPEPDSSSWIPVFVSISSIILVLVLVYILIRRARR